MKKFTAAQFKKFGFVRDADNDFSDDGTRFNSYYLEGYKSQRITYARVEGMIYICISADYSRRGILYDEWSKSPAYDLQDEFNGVDECEVDVEKLVSNIKTVASELDRIESIVKNTKIDFSEEMAELKEEANYINMFIAYFKQNFDWISASEYDLKRAQDYIKSLINEVKKIETFDPDFKEIYYLRNLINNYNKNGYVIFKKNDFYEKSLREYIEKYPVK
jgi:hypothetical protein